MPARALRSLQVRNYRLFLTGQLISVSGTAMQQVAQDWLVVQLTGRALSVALASVLQLGPVLALGPLGGAVADRVDRRRLLVTTQAVLALLALALALLAFVHAIRLWTVYLLAGLLGCVTAFDMPARSALVGDLVGADLVANAVALNTGALNAARAVGPAIAAALVGALGVGAAFLVNGLSYFAVITGLRRMDPVVPPADHSERGRGARPGARPRRCAGRCCSWPRSPRWGRTSRSSSRSWSDRRFTAALPSSRC
ncbi:MAG: hypothetical protein QOG70_730 [Solirubrobacteraceae bacterium]|nr:hypothetical protein [Solirubrobacteraceae bacterium]